MRLMPTALRDLIKSKSMLGDNKPTHEILLGSRPAAITPDGFQDMSDIHVFDPTYRPPKTIQGFAQESGQSHSSWIQIGPSLHMSVFIPRGTKEVLVGYTDNPMTYFTTHYPMQTTLATGINVIVEQRGQISLFQDPDTDEVYMFLKDIREPSQGTRITCYKSLLGDGSDFVQHSIVYENNHDYSRGYPEINGHYVSTPIQLQSGRWLIVFGASTYVSWMWGSVPAVFASYSDDKGATWHTQIVRRQLTWTDAPGQPVQLPDGSIFFEIQQFSTSNHIYRSMTNGATWVNMTPTNEESFKKNFGDVQTDPVYSWGNMFYGSYLYDDIRDVVYRVTGGLYSGSFVFALYNPTAATFMDKSAWKAELYIFSNSPYAPRLWLTEGERHFAIQHVHGYNTVILGLGSTGKTVQAKSITINKSRQASGSASVVFDNTLGKYSPDRQGEWLHEFWPNRQVVIKQGYGNELVETFTGLVDKVVMSSFPQEITIELRDKMKLALDQTITSPSGERVVTFNGQAEEIFVTLARWAGFTEIETGTTGILVQDKTFSYQNYADAFSWLAEITGFEFKCDEYGKIFFTLPVYDNPEVWTLREGEDIVRMDYSISDENIYSKVIVFGATTEGQEPIIAYADPNVGNYYNVLKDKVLVVQAMDAATPAQAQEIADKVARGVSTRARNVDFAAIGIPHLQAGDCIRIFEQTTTMTSVYRINTLSLMQDPNGLLCRLGCNYHEP